MARNKNTRITTIRKTGAGHWYIEVEKDNYSPSTHYLTSVTTWAHTTTDSMAIDAYRSEDNKRVRDGEARLIKAAKAWGTKEIVHY